MTNNKIIIIGIVILCLFSLNINVSASPVVEITMDPEEPEPLSTVTFTANITHNQTIDEVYLEIRECRVGLCYLPMNTSMEFVEGKYLADIELAHSDATYISYQMKIKSDGKWYTNEIANTTLKIETDNGDGNGDQTKDDGDGLPGFEILFFIIAVFITFILIRKKR